MTKTLHCNQKCDWPSIPHEIHRAVDPSAAAVLMALRKGLLYNRVPLHLGWIQGDTGGNCVLHQLEHRGLMTRADSAAGEPRLTAIGFCSPSHQLAAQQGLALNL